MVRKCSRRRIRPVSRMFLTLATESKGDRKSTRLNSSHGYISYAVFCLKKKQTNPVHRPFRRLPRYFLPKHCWSAYNHRCTPRDAVHPACLELLRRISSPPPHTEVRLTA